ncbi:family 61 glycoside hydrolase [Stachybotrys elegans]|uniref:lytic cellulose monooxygenase (C4-dehydrogenating) n=1 Tax=Stachybotrys elegans TaxID=80388 RepID=A0A8K0WK75_9HYPO|nr:family 61 glycoside hydrolase [Stachybotrys elegans]
MAASMAKTALGLLALASGVLSHGLVTSYTVDGEEYGGFLLDYYYDIVNGGTAPDIAAWYAENLDIGFVEPNAYGTAAINCHKNAKPGKLYTTVAAGGSVTFDWTPKPWPHPYGPILAYVAKCDGECTDVNPTSLRWVKIEEQGIDYDTQVWAQAQFVDQDSNWTVNIPESLAPGNYVLRHELIALHGAASANGAQNYPQCFNIKITGSGTANPTGVPGTSLYKATDPGILFNPYVTITNYVIPGPALWRG